MTDTHGNIQSKGLDGTGITEEIVGDHFNRVGAHMMAIVDLQVVDKAGPNLKGKRKVTYVIDGIEPATDEDLAEHLRELQRTVYLNRQHSGAQRAIGEELDDEPTVEGVVAAGAAHRPHPFLPVDASQDNPLCDVCGMVEATPRHSVQDELPDGDEDDETGDETDQGDADLEAEQAEPDEDKGDEEYQAEPGGSWEYDTPEPATSTIGSPFNVPDPAA